jgi:hypothetical protein
MGLYPNLWTYRTITDHEVAGQRFRIEEAMNQYGVGGYGYEYFVDEVEVTPMVFDRSISLAKFAAEQKANEQKPPGRKRAA